MGKADPAVEGRELAPASEARVVRVVDGERMVTDGPFAETKEQLGGFYLLECKDLDEAIDWAAQLPSARRGGVCEIRPVLAYEGYEDPQTAREGAAS